MSTLTVIHRFMAAHSTIGQTGADTHAIPEMRLDAATFRRMRHASEHSEPHSETSESIGARPMGGSFGGISHQSVLKRRAPVRSMTEVRPCGAGDTFLMADMIRALRESSETSPITVGDGSKRSSVIDEKEDLLAVEVRNG